MFFGLLEVSFWFLLDFPRGCRSMFLNLSSQLGSAHGHGPGSAAGVFISLDAGASISHLPLL